MNQEIYESYLQILKEELLPAMGCTEPIAIAYGAAKAREVLGALPERVVVHASGNIIKNVKSVVVPNTGGLRGIEAAAAAGIVAGRPELQLEVISQVTEEELQAVREYLQEDRIRVVPAESPLIFDVIVDLEAGADRVRVRIANYHTNIVAIEKNGEALLELPITPESSQEGLTDRSILNVEDIVTFAETVPFADLEPLIGR